MRHPPVSALLGGLSPEVASHVASCTTCQRIADGARPVARAEAAREAGVDLTELPIIDPAVYAHRQPEVRGGMGRTFVARDRRLGRDVAIKQPLGPGEDIDPILQKTLRLRFEREARLTARLEHPAIVGVYEAGQFPDGQPFYAMRLVRGTPLVDEISRRATLAERIALLPNLTIVAEALAYAHSRGVTHRDVKPANILIGEFSETVLIDWGLATDCGAPIDGETRVAGPGHALPLTRYGVGTPGYMPPEQAAGGSAEASADVYALGATLYHLLAGRAPARTPSSLATICPDAPAALVALVGRAMAARPSDRLTAAALVEELQRYHAGRLVESHHYSPRELVSHYLRRYRVPLAIVAMALVVLIAVSIAYVRSLARETERAETALRAAEASNDEMQLALHRQLGVTATQLARDPTHRLDALEAGVRAVSPELARGARPMPEAWQGLLDALAVDVFGVSLVGGGGLSSLAFFSSGDRLVTAGSDSTIRLWEVPSGRVLAQFKSSLERAQTVWLSPDETRVLLCGFDPIAELIALDGAPVIPIPLPQGNARCGFTPTGLAVVLAGPEVRAFDATGKVVARASLTSEGTALSIDRTGIIAIGTDAGELLVWSLAGTPATFGIAHRGGLRAIAFFDGGNQLATGGLDGRALAWPIVDGLPTSPKELFSGGPPVHQVSEVAGDLAFITTPAPADFAASSTMIVHAAGTTSIARLAVYDNRSGTDSVEDGFVAGASLAGARLVDPRSGHDLLVLPKAGDRFHRFARRGQIMITGSVDGTTMLWDIGRGLSTGLAIGHWSEVTAIVSSADGIWSASLDGTLRRWTATRRTAVVTEAGTELLTLVASKDRSTLASVGIDGSVRVHEAGGAIRAVLSIAGTPLGFAALAPDQTRILTNASAGRARLWDARTGAAVETLAIESPAAVTTGVFSEDGKTVVLGAADGSVTRFEGGTATASVRLPESSPIERLELVEDAIAIATVSMRTVILDARTLAARVSLPGRLVGIAANHAVVAEVEGGIRLQPLDGAATRVLDGHRRPVAAAAVSGARLATADLSGNVRIWNHATGVLLASFAFAGLGTPTTVAFLDDGVLAVGGSQGAIRTIPVDPARAVERACTILSHFSRGDACGPR